jgi:hypothetical protein
MSYKIVRFYRDNEAMNGSFIVGGLTLEEAQAHCNDPETSSATAASPAAVEHTAKHGAWFDGWTKEDGDE